MQGTDRTMLELLAWMVWGALVFGTVGWVLVVLVVTSVPASAGLIAGLATGGGVGAVVRLLVFSDVEDTSETVTLDVGPDGIPGPEPVDLFEAHPDPLLYYHSDDELVVLASNPTFAERFGDGKPIEHSPLADSLVGPAVDEIVAAASDGRHLTLDQRVENGENGSASDSSDDTDDDSGDETVDGRDRAVTYRIRVVPVGSGRVRGYVQYTPLPHER